MEIDKTSFALQNPTERAAQQAAVSLTAPLPASRRAFRTVTRALCLASVLLVVAILVGLLLYIFVRGIPHITWNLLTTAPSVLKGNMGILPNILNTLYIIVLTLIIALPIGVGGAVYLNEYAPRGRLRSIIEFTTETLTGIPSIIYGLVGMLFFAQSMGLQTSIYAGALTLVIMILPIIVRTTQEALKTVPDNMREGALALGSTKWHMIRTILIPSSLDGILTGCILSIGRIVGESAALIFTAGIASVLAGNVFDALSHSGATLAVALYVYVFERGQFNLGFAIASILVLLVFFVNLAAKRTGRRFKTNL